MKSRDFKRAYLALFLLFGTFSNIKTAGSETTCYATHDQEYFYDYFTINSNRYRHVNYNYEDGLINNVINLPYELLLYILSFLDYDDIAIKYFVHFIEPRDKAKYLVFTAVANLNKKLLAKIIYIAPRALKETIASSGDTPLHIAINKVFMTRGHMEESETLIDIINMIIKNSPEIVLTKNRANLSPLELSVLCAPEVLSIIIKVAYDLDSAGKKE